MIFVFFIWLHSVWQKFHFDFNEKISGSYHLFQWLSLIFINSANIYGVPTLCQALCYTLGSQDEQNVWLHVWRWFFCYFLKPDYFWYISKVLLELKFQVSVFQGLITFPRKFWGPIQLAASYFAMLRTAYEDI